MKTFKVALKITLLFTLLLGGIYPLLVTLTGRILFPKEATGQILEQNGIVIGSALIGQSTQNPKWFWWRPQEVSNFSPKNRKLQDLMEQRRKMGLQDEMLYASGSGLDPDIRPGSAFAQIPRVSAQFQLNDSEVKELHRLVEMQIQPPQFHLFGEPRVNVLALNLKFKEWLIQHGKRP